MTEEPLAQAAQIESQREQIQREWASTQARMDAFRAQHAAGDMTNEQLDVAQQHYVARRQRVETFMANRKAFYAHYQYLTPDDLAPPKPKHVPQHRTQDETWSVRGRGVDPVSYPPAPTPDNEDNPAESAPLRTPEPRSDRSKRSQSRSSDEPKSSLLGIVIVVVLVVAILAAGGLVLRQLIASDPAATPAPATTKQKTAPKSATSTDPSTPSTSPTTKSPTPTSPAAKSPSTPATVAPTNPDAPASTAPDGFLKLQ